MPGEHLSNLQNPYMRLVVNFAYLFYSWYFCFMLTYVKIGLSFSKTEYSIDKIYLFMLYGMIEPLYEYMTVVYNIITKICQSLGI